MADVTVDASVSDPGELLKLGIKAYFLRDYNAGATAFSRAIEIIVAEHNDKHDSLGPYYLHYGKTLLEISREETEALGDAVTRDLNNSSDSDEDEPNKVEANKLSQAADSNKSEEVKDVESTNGSDKPKTDATPVGEVKPVEQNSDKATGDDQNGENPTDKDQNKDDKVTDDTSANKPSSSAAASEAKPTEESESTEEKVEEEPTDLQLAWEVLELAKLIFENRGDAGKKELAETLVVLGEVSLESENFENAIADIKRGLEIQKNIFSSDSRYLSETHYKLAMALSTNNQLDEAIDNYNISLTILNNKLTKLKEKNEAKHQDEIKELESLIPEIEEKIADLKSYKEETANKLVSALTSKEKTEEKFEAGSSKEANDISHLVKRKRKLEDIVEECGENPAKKSNV